MKAYGGVDVQSHVLFTSAVAGGEWLSSRPGRFTPGADMRLYGTQNWSGRHAEEKILGLTILITLPWFLCESCIEMNYLQLRGSRKESDI
jgi:hypothetical protein